MANNKIKFGLKKVHYAVITTAPDGTISYGVPKAFPGAVELKLAPRGDKLEFYADDILYVSGENNDGYDGTFEAALIPDSFRQEILGEKVSGNALIYESAEKITNNAFALLFEFIGDEKAARHALYNCRATRPSIEGTRKTKSIEPKTEVLNFIASPREEDEIIQAKRYRAAEGEDTVYDGWYSAVVLPAEV